MADETQDEQENLTNPDESQETAENTSDDQESAEGAESPSGQTELEKRLAKLEAQLERSEQSRAQLEQTVRLQDRYFQQQRGTQSQQVSEPEDDGLTPELRVLDKALEPIIQKRFRGQLDPVNQRYAEISDTIDANRFDNFLMRNAPDVFEDEDSYNRTMQQVESVRQAARERGVGNISRVDAYVFAQGMDFTRQSLTSRKQKRKTAAQNEIRRSAEVSAAEGTSRAAAPRRDINAGIQAIREKANRGERLTADERSKLFSFAKDVEI